MKKRIISMLLTVLMVMSLFSGLTVTADAANYNGANVIEYTMAQGDFVLRICQRLGLNYYTCKNAIMILNNIQDGQWNKLTVGRTLYLPASDYDALLISNGAGTTVYNSGAASTTATTSNVTGTATTGTVISGTTATATTAAAASADILAYYLVPYTMSYGETVSGVCNALGVNFSIFSPFIKQVNNISDWSRVRAGDTLIIPTPVAPTVGVTCYGVMEHTVASSDTAYGIVSSKGVNYNANERLLKVLNQTENLAAIKAGGKFFYPVPLTISVPGTGNPGSTATTTTTTTVSDANGTTTTQTTTTSKLYKLSGGLSASDGTMLFYVDSQPVTAAPAGAKVTIMTSTNSGKAIQSLTVKHADGTADLHLSGDSFIMPSCDVRVDAVIKTGHDININANYSGKANASVGGISVLSAVKGATVIIKSNDPNYEIASVTATYKKLVASSTKTQLTVSASKAFVMPDADVDVEVVLKPVSTYAFYVNDPANGSFYLQVNGAAATRAAKGATVTVVAKPASGYEPRSLTVKNHTTGAAINVFSNTFTMPAFDVDVEVRFTGKGNNILMMPSQFGNVYAFLTGTPSISSDEDLENLSIEDAETGTEVFLKIYNEDGAAPVEVWSGYKIDYDVVRNSDGLKVSVDKSKMSFKMPKGGVTVTPIISAVAKKEIYAKFFVNNEAVTGYNDCSFSITWNGKTSEFTETLQKISTLKAIKSAIPVGEYIDLRYDSADGVAFVKYRITDGKTDPTVFEEETNEANLRGYFKMPNANIEIEAYFETGKVAIGPAVITGVGTATYRDEANKYSINSCNPGDKVLIDVVPGNGFSFDYDKYASKLIVTRKDNGAPLTLLPVNPVTKDGKMVSCDYFVFEMPAAGVDVQAIFDAKPFIITMKCVDETGANLTGRGLWQVAINMQPGVVDNDPSLTQTRFTVAYEDYVTVAMTEAGWSNYDMVSFRINDKEYVADVLNYFYNFQMIDERAQDLDIVAVLRPRVPYTVGIHSLYAYQYDATKGGVDFVILDSPTGYSDKERLNGTGALNYVHNAVTGDKVGIVVNTLSDKYTVKPEDISIMAYLDDADRIVPTEGWIDAWGNPVAAGTPNALHVFTFTMPNSDVYVGVNFTGQKQILMINVVDENDQPISGMIRFFANNVYRDIGADNSFDDVPYNTPIQLTRSELALAENKRIDKVDIFTADGKSVTYTDLSSGGEGISFLMPASSAYVYIKLGNVGDNLPTVVVRTNVSNGKLIFKKSMDTNAPSASISDFSVGDTVYVYGVPNSGYSKLEPGDLKVYVNGQNNAANLVGYVDEFGNLTDVGLGNNVSPLWQFKLPAGAIIFEASFEKREAEVRNIKLNILGQPDGKVKASVGDYTGTYGDGTVLEAAEGQTITLAPSSSSGFTMIEVRSGKGLSGTTYKVPTGLTVDSNGIWDELTITLPAKTNETAEVTIISADEVTIESAAVSGAFKNAGGTKFVLPVGTTLTVTSNTTGKTKVKLSSTSGKGVSGNTYTVPDVANDTLTITLSSTSNPINTNFGAHGSILFFSDAARTTPIVASSIDTGATVYWQSNPDAGYQLKNIKATEIVNSDTVVDTSGGSFTMPAGGVNVTATFEARSVQITLRILDKSNVGKDVDAATGLTESVKITVNGTEVTYKDKMVIDTKTDQKLVFPANASVHKISSVQVYKGTERKNGSALTNTNYTVAGSEQVMVVFVDTSAKASTTPSSSHISMFLEEGGEVDETDAIVENVENVETTEVETGTEVTDVTEETTEPETVTEETTEPETVVEETTEEVGETETTEEAGE